MVVFEIHLNEAETHTTRTKRKENIPISSLILSYSPFLPGACDPIDHGVKQYIQEKKGLKAQEEKELWKIAATLRKPGVGDSHNLGYIEYSLGSEISSTGREMLQKQFETTMEPRSNKVFESGKG